jgi:hypothetical protein
MGHSRFLGALLIIAPTPVFAQPNDMAHCAMAMQQARAGNYLPDGSWLPTAAPATVPGAPNRDQCAARAGDTMFQLTYDRLCAPGFERQCTRLVSVVRASDGKVLFVELGGQSKAPRRQ